MAIIEDLRGQVDLSEHGIEAGGTVHHNPTIALLYTRAQAGHGTLAEGEAARRRHRRAHGPLAERLGLRRPGAEHRGSDLVGEGER